MKQTLEQAANEYSEGMDAAFYEGVIPDSVIQEFAKKDFKEGANWQKEKDKELIEELLESLKTVTKIPIYRREFGNGSIDLKAQHAITKAENYLKQ